MWPRSISKVNIISIHKHDNTVLNMGCNILHELMTKMKLKSLCNYLLLWALPKPAACPFMKWGWMSLFLCVDREFKVQVQLLHVQSLSLSEWFSSIMTQEGLEIPFPCFPRSCLVKTHTIWERSEREISLFHLPNKLHWSNLLNLRPTWLMCIHLNLFSRHIVVVTLCKWSSLALTHK